MARALESALPVIPGARLGLQGSCNRCGLCCTAEYEGQRVVCEHLKAVLEGGRVKALGSPEASVCGVYEQRVSGMPIRMLDQAGVVRLVIRCFKNSWEEDYAIAFRGLGKGCSLTMPVFEGQLVKFEPTKRR